jgi:UDP-N-acetylmuramoylalanine--D-glutamate ligase
MFNWLPASNMTRALPTDAQLAGQRVTVMGLGRFGGGLGVSQWLLSRGALVTITDIEPEHRLAASVQALKSHPQFANARLVLGTHQAADFTSCDLVIANVAVPTPWNNPFLQAALQAGIAISTEIALTVDRLRTHHNVIGITGTVGKSTTTAMVHEALQACGRAGQAQGHGFRVHMGGNIGGSLLADLATLHPRDWVVLELSSAQLWWIAQLLQTERRWSPHIAALTTFADNHGDWHGDISHYHASKAAMFAHQQRGDVAIFGPGLDGQQPQGKGFSARESVKIRRVLASDFARKLALPGAHNVLNAAIAHAVVSEAAPGHEHIASDALAAFRGLAHRLQLVSEVQGVRFYNDSKSTTPGATLTALQALREAGSSRVHLIAGGYDKHSDLAPIASAAKQLAGLYTIGATGPAIHAQATALGAAGVHACQTLDAAMQAIAHEAKPGDSVLLSPGCASWDQFENFEQRGDAFVQLVKQLAGA